MFEIAASLKNVSHAVALRIRRYLTHCFLDDTPPIVSPHYVPKDTAFADTDRMIVSFRGLSHHNAPYVTISQLESVCNAFSSIKEKTLIALSAMGTDYYLNCKCLSVPITANRAQLLSHLRKSTVFYDASIGAPYFTYMASCPHLVWFENTQSLAQKHNLIKNAGFRGIYWETPYALPEGNWEAMFEVWNKKDSLP